MSQLQNTQIFQNAKTQMNCLYKIIGDTLDRYIENAILIDNSNQELKKAGFIRSHRRQNFPSEVSENIASFALYKKYNIETIWDTKKINAKGDLIVANKGDTDKITFSPEQIIEVKAFSSLGPSSFGPNEEWSMISFVDATQYKDKHFKVYLIRLSNQSPIWREIVISGCSNTRNDYPELPVLDNLNINNLKDLCKQRDLCTTGSKQVLLNRLRKETPGSKLKPPKTYGEIANHNRRGELRTTFDIIQSQIEGHCELIFDGHWDELKC